MSRNDFYAILDHKNFSCIGGEEETFSVVLNLEMSTVDTLNGLMRLTLVPAMDFSKLEMGGMPGVNVVGEELLDLLLNFFQNREFV